MLPLGLPFRWKLALSYTVVGVLTLIILETIALALFFGFLWSDLLPQQVTYALQEAATRVVPYLESDPPNIEALRQWAITFAQPNLSVQTGPGGLYLGTAPLGGEGHLLVIDSQYRVLLSVPDAVLGGRVPGLEDFPDLVPLLQQTLAGERSSRYIRQPDGTLLTAVPLVGEGGETLGWMVAVLHLPVTLQLFLLTIGQFAGKTLLLLIGPVGLISLLIGMIVSRPLVWRLRHMEETADRWGKGDFAARIDDPHRDELGQLASRLNQMAAQLQDMLVAEKQRALQEERHRMARDLHDTIKQRLFAIHIQTAALGPLIERGEQKTAAEVLSRITEQISQAQNEITQVVHNLWPQEPEGEFHESLQTFLNSWSRWSGVAATFRASCSVWDLAPGVKEAIQRILQEALTNVARHSGATQVEVLLERSADHVLLTIADNGKGFIPTQVRRKGWGLSSMEEHARAVGGTLTLESAPYRGTRVVLKIPTSCNRGLR